MNLLKLINRQSLTRAALGATLALGVHACTDIGSGTTLGQDAIPVVTAMELSREEVREFERFNVVAPQAKPNDQRTDEQEMFRPFVDSSPIPSGVSRDHLEHVNGASFTTTGPKLLRTKQVVATEDLPPIVGPESAPQHMQTPHQLQSSQSQSSQVQTRRFGSSAFQKPARMETQIQGGSRVDITTKTTTSTSANLPEIVLPNSGASQGVSPLFVSPQSGTRQPGAPKVEAILPGTTSVPKVNIGAQEFSALPPIEEVPEKAFAKAVPKSLPNQRSAFGAVAPIPVQHDSTVQHSTTGQQNSVRTIPVAPPTIDLPRSQFRQVVAQVDAAGNQSKSLPEFLPEIPGNPPSGSSQGSIDRSTQPSANVLPSPSNAAPGYDGAPSVHDHTIGSHGINSNGVNAYSTNGRSNGRYSNASQQYDWDVTGSALPSYQGNNRRRVNPASYDALLSHSYSGNHSSGGDCLDYGYGCHNGSPNYFFAEALFFDRGSDFISLSDTFALDPYDYEFGGRVTFGRRSDQLSGSEISYVGPFEWEDNEIRHSAGNSLNSAFIAGTGIVPANFSAFNNARYHQQSIDSNLNSLEYNRTWCGWDIMQFSLGGRYVRLEDKYQFLSVNGAGERGSYNLDTLNNLFGPQAGLEIFYDTGRRLSYSLRGKVGLMANMYEGESRFNNNGFLVNNSDKENLDLSGLFEFGATAHYQLGPSFRLRGGYEVWSLTDVATADRNVSSTISRSSGRDISNNDNVVVHGLSLGLELFW